MTYKTHSTTSLAIAIPSLIVINELSIFSVIGVLIGAVLPDIDSPKSYISKRIPIIPNLIYKKFGHRGVIHSLSAFFFLILISIIIKLFEIFNFIHSNIPVILSFSIAFGFLLHLCGDGLSVSGLRWFAPFNKKLFSISNKSKFHFLVYKTNYFNFNKYNNSPNDKLKKREFIYLLIATILIVIEIFYFKNQISYSLKHTIEYNNNLFNSFLYHRYHKYY